MADEKEKKIIVDEDWKQQAKKEKETLAKEQQEEAPQEGDARGPLPPGDIAALISMLVTQAFFAMGILKIKGQEERESDLEMAKYNIDMLATLEEKTKGNLDDQEQKVLTDSLHQLRMAYVELTKGQPQGE